MAATQTPGGLVLSFPCGKHVAPAPSTETLVAQAKEWHELAATHHFGARVAMARGDFGAAVSHLIHERGKLDQMIAIMKEARGLPTGKRALELEALQLVLGAVKDELAFLPGVTPNDTANTLEAAAERVDNVQARLLTMAECFRHNTES